MSSTERVRLLGGGVNKVIEIPAGTDNVEHEGQLFQRTPFGHSVGPDEPIASFHLVEDDKH